MERAEGDGRPQRPDPATKAATVATPVSIVIQPMVSQDRVLARRARRAPSF